MNAEIIIDGCQEVRMNKNGVDAVCVNAGANLSLIRIKDCPSVEMNENGSWGTNGGDIEILNSLVDISRNSDNPWARVSYTSSNLYAESLKVEKSTVTANNCGANCGIWVESSANIENSTEIIIVQISHIIAVIIRGIQETELHCAVQRPGSWVLPFTPREMAEVVLLLHLRKTREMFRLFLLNCMQIKMVFLKILEHPEKE